MTSACRFRRLECILGRDHAKRGVAPAQQALGPHDLAEAQIVLRLEHEIERVLHNRRTQPVLVHKARLPRILAAFDVHRNPARNVPRGAACVLGSLKQGFRLIAVARIHGDPDRGTRIDFFLADPEWRVQRAQGLLSREQRYGGTLDGRKHAGDVISAHVADKIVRAEHVSAQRRRNPGAHGVADMVTPQRIDLPHHPALHEQHGQIPAVGAPLLDASTQRL